MGWSVPRVPENRFCPPTSVRVIVFIVIVYAVILLMWRGYGLTAALSAVAAIATFSQDIARRVIWWSQRPDLA